MKLLLLVYTSYQATDAVFYVLYPQTRTFGMQCSSQPAQLCIVFAFFSCRAYFKFVLLYDLLF
jgi:hypothetical protein